MLEGKFGNDPTAKLDLKNIKKFQFQWLYDCKHFDNHIRNQCDNFWNQVSNNYIKEKWIINPIITNKHTKRKAGVVERSFPIVNWIVFTEKNWFQKEQGGFQRKYQH